MFDKHHRCIPVLLLLVLVSATLPPFCAAAMRNHVGHATSPSGIDRISSITESKDKSAARNDHKHGHNGNHNRKQQVQKKKGESAKRTIASRNRRSPVIRQQKSLGTGQLYIHTTFLPSGDHEKVSSHRQGTVDSNKHPAALLPKLPSISASAKRPTITNIEMGGCSSRDTAIIAANARTVVETNTMAVDGNGDGLQRRVLAAEVMLKRIERSQASAHRKETKPANTALKVPSGGSASDAINPPPPPPPPKPATAASPQKPASTEQRIVMSIAGRMFSNFKRDFKELFESGFTWWEYLFTAITVAALGVSTSAMILEASLLVDILAWMTLFLAPSAAIYHRKVVLLEGLRKVTNDLREQVDRVSASNKDLKIQNKRLEKNTKKLESVSGSLETISAANGMNVDTLIKQVEEYKQIQSDIKLDLRSRVQQTLLSVFLRSDTDEDYVIDPNEVNRLVLRLKSIPGVEFDEPRFKKALNAENGDVIKFFDKHFADAQTLEREKIFMF